MSKIVHICLCGPVTDGLTYQDNLLPKYHKKNGHEVSVITSKFIWDSSGKIAVDNRSTYLNEYGIKVIRIENRLNSTIESKFKTYKNLLPTIDLENPDILFIHGVQFLDLIQIKRYLNKKPEINVFIDNHADFSNSATNWVSKNVLHGVIWKKLAKLMEPRVEKFYGVLPARVEFLKEMYDISENKIELLLMGADDDMVHEVKNKSNRENIRKKYGIKQEDFLIVTGGKIDIAKKQTLTLMRVVCKMEDNVKLLVFGSVDEKLKEELTSIIDGKKIQYLGWANSKESYEYFNAADLVVFPGRHSVYWEQVVGLGIPLAARYWEGTTHINIGGNVVFFTKDTAEEIQKKIHDTVFDNGVYTEMLKKANSNNKNFFLYSNIAKKSLN